ncbi:MAG: hypothetical protein JJU29_07580 [Verrucomicrobia bacterium]|nr:hypothetical protein [Verrucomicrobiota bacterium]MCH8511637.1 hypothetical protein [Kiritimatiellia bacterium]
MSENATKWSEQGLPDPGVLAGEEVRMWRAYYQKRWLRLGWRLVRLLRRQFRLSTSHAICAGWAFGSAAMRFARSNPAPREAVLRDLKRGYRRVARASGMKFDPEAVANAEWAWWEARRDPKQDTPELVGRKIGDLYANLYGGRNDALSEAGYLRARAAKLRDDAGARADWARIEAMLLTSYARLREGVAAIRASTL